jgi:phage gp36-like protein
MAYADLTSVDTILNHQIKARQLKRLFNIAARKADSIIDAKLGVLFDTPFTTTPALVRNIAEDLTAYYLLRSKYFAGVAGNDEESRREYWDDAMRLLKGIIEGDIILPDVDPADESGRRAALIDSTNREYHPVFDVGPADQWTPDADYLVVLANEKIT